MTWTDTPNPHLRPVEHGRMIAPEYGNTPQSMEIVTAEWHHLASARFGPGRPCGWGPSTLWTGNSYRYDIFIHQERKQVALRWWNGSGEGWLISQDYSERHEQSLLRHIASLEDETIRWDFCHFVWQATEKSRLAGETHSTQLFTTAFLENRLKRRQRQGITRVEILPHANV